MNAKDLRPIFEEVLLDLPGFTAHKRMILMTPMRGMLRAVHCDPSAFSKDDFQVEAFIMPLCVPSDHISLLFGEPLRHPATGGWGGREPCPISSVTFPTQSGRKRCRSWSPSGQPRISLKWP